MENENTCLYQSDFTHDLNVQKEFLQASQQLNSFVKFLHLFIICVLLWFFYEMFFLLDAPEEFSGGIFSITVIYLIFEGIRLLSHHKGGIHYKRSLVANGGKPVRASIQFREEDILSLNLDNQGKSSFRYDQIKAVYETKNLFLFAMKYRLFLIVDKRTLSGNREDFIAFLLPRCSKIRRKKIHNVKIGKIINAVKWAVILIMLIIALFYHPVFQLKQRLSGQIHNGMSASDVLGELESFGITCDDPEMIEHMYGGTFYFYGNRMESILYQIGMGTYDYEQECWIPTGTGVRFMQYWTFDDQETMYTNLLRHISTLDGDALVIDAIREDHSNANFVSNEGVVIVEFLLQGNSYRLEAKARGDMYDIQFMNDLNQIISDQTGNCLYFAEYENTGYFIFYGDDAWADTFSRRTGLELTTQMEYPY